MKPQRLKGITLIPVVKDIYFNYDKADIRADQQSVPQGNTNFLCQHPNIHFAIEGRCDERGSAEYNLALSDNRASMVQDALTPGGSAVTTSNL